MLAPLSDGRRCRYECWNVAFGFVAAVPDVNVTPPAKH